MDSLGVRSADEDIEEKSFAEPSHTSKSPPDGFAAWSDDLVRRRPVKESTKVCSKATCEKFWAPVVDFFRQCCEKMPCYNNDDEKAAATPPDRILYVGPAFDENEQIACARLKTDDSQGSVAYDFCDNYVSTTKYTLWTFFPVNMFEQFQKKANFYFLIIATLSFTSLSPKLPIFSVAPLTFVLSVSAVKECYEDWKRFEMDKEINNRKVLTFRPTSNAAGTGWKFRELAWQDVAVGDVVKIPKFKAGSNLVAAFPADILLLQSSTAQGLCNIETSNLDGETNLKIKQAVSATYSIWAGGEGDSFPKNRLLNFELHSEAPNEKMDKSSWKGALHFKGDEHSSDPVAVGMNQLLLRGCTLRNTEWIIGLVIFTGVETKLMLNNKARAFKRSNVDLIVDKALYVIFFVQACLCSFGAVAHKIWLSNEANDQWYQYVDGDGDPITSFSKEAGLNYFTFLVLLDLFVPISLYVSMELVKFAQAWLINQDHAMKSEDHNGEDIYGQARTSNLNEELGQVDFIFSDKTGTLTQNKMEFLKCHVDKIRYGPDEMELQHAYQDQIQCPLGMPPFNAEECRFTDNRLGANAEHSQPIDDFLTLLAVCHSIIPEYPDGHDGPVVYQAASPDEKALVVFAKNLHYFFFDSHVQVLEFRGKQIDGHRFYVNVRGNECAFDIYHMLEFNSARKRMSVVIKDPRDQKFKLFCKGADNVIFQRLRAEDKQTQWPSAIQSLGYFAADGLRTLACGMRVLSDDEYYEWLDHFLTAKASMENRDELVDEAYNQIECELSFVGCTAIEDRLQDGVPNTIANLAVAGISIWVLTGDKVETAINIGRSCRLLNANMTRDNKKLIVIDPDEKLSDKEAFHITEKAFDETWALLEDKPQNDASQAFVVSGKALGYVFPHRKRDARGNEIPPSDEQKEIEAEMQKKCLRICRKCRAVICCRVSPKQKAQMVGLVKNNVAGTITLAIGDGANDVPMIKSAHVGIGISGQEGLQAVMASDYAVGQFRFLQELLLVHGAWDYRRISILILYSFYKNIMFSMTQIWMSFYSGFSGVLYYDSFSGSCYNMVFTAFPVLFAAVLDRPYSKKIAKLCPELYSNGPGNGSFNLRIFAYYAAEGMMHSMCIFWGTTFFIDSKTFDDGTVVGFWTSATTLFSAVVSVATLKMILETRTWTRWSVLMFFLSELAWFVFALVWSVIPPKLGWGNSDIYQVAQHAFEMPQFWFAVMFVGALCILPEIILRYLLRMFRPTRLNVIEEMESYPDKRNKFISDACQYMAKSEKSIAKKTKAEADRQISSLEGHLGYTEFHLDPSHPDYIMPQESYLRAVATKPRKIRFKIFGKSKNKDKK